MDSPLDGDHFLYYHWANSSIIVRLHDQGAIPYIQDLPHQESTQESAEVEAVSNTRYSFQSP